MLAALSAAVPKCGGFGVLQTQSAVKRSTGRPLRCIAASNLKQGLSLRLPPLRDEDYLSDRGNSPLSRA
jgi:hypothetical protein